MNCIVFEDGEKIENVNQSIWDGLFSKVSPNGKIIQYIAHCLPKNTLFVIPVSDGNINKKKDDGNYHDVDWDSQIQPYLNYAKEKNKIFMIGTLCQLDEESGINYVYLPLDDNLFSYGIDNFFNKTNLPSWEIRSSNLCWRGGCSGYGGYASLRVKFVETIYKYNSNTDVRLSRWWSENKSIPEKYFAEPSRDRISYQDFTNYKIFFIVDGNVIASNHMYGFATGCVPFLVTKSCSKFWFLPFIIPYVHYIPIKDDLSNLIEQIEWVNLNDEEAKKISENAYEFAITHFSKEYQHENIKKSIEQYCIPDCI